LVENGSASSSSIAAALTEYAFSRPERPMESAKVVRGVIEQALAANRQPEQIRKAIEAGVDTWTTKALGVAIGRATRRKCSSIQIALDGVRRPEPGR
jgi:hypothetical protein